MILSWSGSSQYVCGLILTNPAPIGAGSPSPQTEYSDMSMGDIMRKVFDRDNSSIHVIDAGTASGTYGSPLGADQIIRRVFDTSHVALRVVKVSGGALTATGHLDWQQVIQHCYDPTKEALRVLVNPATSAIGAANDAETILEKLFNHPNSALRVTTPGTVSVNLGTHLDWRQIWKKTLDATNGRLQVVE